MTPLRMLAWALLAVIGFTPALADPHPNVQRGFAPDKAFAVGEIDAVNVFNGNLNLSIPIGPSYPIRENFSYQLTLVNNSKLWDFIQTHDGTTYAYAKPSWHNAGIGWTLSLGRLLPPCASLPQDCVNQTGFWQYRGPDGAEHLFFDRLHPNSPEVPQPDVWYTRDGSYLRLKSGSWQVEFPDGTVHTFRSWDGYPSEIRDPFGNALTIAYVATAAQEYWSLYDGHRFNFVHFAPSGGQFKKVTRVDLASFGGGYATYWFDYRPGQMVLPRAQPCTDTARCGDVAVDLLVGVRLPDGSSYSMPESDYHTQTDHPGVIRAVTLPTLARIEWTYGAYVFPSEDAAFTPPCPGSGPEEWCREKLYRSYTGGVYDRTVRIGGVAHTWTYRQYATFPGGLTEPPHPELRYEVTTPLGHKTVHYYWAPVQNAAYGLPLSQGGQNGENRSDGFGRYLSTQTFNGSTLLRSTYVAYDYDTVPGWDGQTYWSNTNRRQRTTRTVYHDDGGRFAETTLSSFDGYGHFRTEQTGGSFDAGNVRTGTTNYNPTTGTFPGSFTLLPLGAKWILGTFDLQEEVETVLGVTTIARRTFDVDATNGWVRRTRIHELDNGARSPNDLIVEAIHVGGDLRSERFHGGDTQTVGTSAALGSLSLPQPQYRIDHITQHGARATSTYVDPATGAPLSFKTLDLTIDVSTGLPSSGRDTAGLSTTFGYDLMGRLLFERPQAGQDAWTEYVYTRATSLASPARIHVSRQPNGGGVPLTERLIVFDALGRVWQEQERRLGDLWATRETLYNEAGWKSSVSELGNTSKRTLYLGYDPFGRPTTIRPPDGSAHDVTLTYQGIRLVKRKVRVATSQSAESEAETTEIYDRQGRLYQLLEPANPDGSVTTTTYTHDVGNRLRKVRQVTASGIQEREIVYDQRGFLSSEKHPEKGQDGNGWVTYSGYDARGHVGEKVDGPFELRFTYDRAERNTRIDEVISSGLRPVKTLTYGISTISTNRSNGKLEQASRFNYHPDVGATVEVIETYTYGGKGGRVSRRNTATRVNGSFGPETWRLTCDYNELGEITSIGYPDCTTSCPSRPRQVAFTREKGLLTAVPGYAQRIGYYPNGLYSEIQHANGVIDVQANDPNGMARPRQLYSQLAGADLWRSGLYHYDGTGNVKRIGNTSFFYDKVSRVVDGHVYDGPTGAGSLRFQTYAYDSFGNLTSIGGDAGSPGRDTPTNAATNRLSLITGAAYDGAGNLTRWSNNEYEYDSLGMIRRRKIGTEDWRYVYTADDERLWSYRIDAPGSAWALRDLHGKILREYEATGGNWSLFRDYIYRDGQLLAEHHSVEGVRHLHLDHLGTPRLVTQAGASEGFYTVSPCRIYDSRGAAALQAGETRQIAIAGTCGIPALASAVALNLAAVDATASGHLTAYPAGETRPTTWAISYLAGVNRATNGVLKLGGGALSFYNDQASGTSHLLIDVSGYFIEGTTAAAYHVYFPFGEEITPVNQIAGEQMRFTGHERDLQNQTTPVDDLDYMHARFYNPQLGRFLSTDPIDSAKPGQPQSWNRYAYTVNNPLKYVDPDGKAVQAAPLLLGAWAAAEVGLSVWDAVETGRTLADPSASAGEKATATGLFAAGLIGPGGAYGRLGDAAIATARARRIGALGEDAVRAAYNIGDKAQLFVPGSLRFRIADGFNRSAGTLSEVKNVARQSFTGQLRDFVAIAKANSVKFVLYVREDTILSKPLVEAVKKGDIHLVRMTLPQ